jgi:protease-4
MGGPPHGAPPGAPSMMMPPPMFYPPPPAPRERSFARGIFTTLAMSIFGLSIALNVYLLFATALMSGSKHVKQEVLTEGAPTEEIAVIPVSGIIRGETSKEFDRILTLAEKDSNVKALIIDVDTPGGEVGASDEIYQRILKFKAEKAKKGLTAPVIATMGALATSGGYYVSCAADYIVAQPTTLTGNIGVIMPRYNVSKLCEKWGIEETTIASTGATFKNAGSMFQPEKPEDRAYIQNLIDQTFTQFKTVVSTGRGTNLKGTIDSIANGKVYTAGDAAKLGLIDKIGYMSDAISQAAKLAGLTKQHVVRYEQPPSLFDVLGAKSNLPAQGASGNVTINGVNVTLDPRLLQEFTTPRMMYLWRGE